MSPNSAMVELTRLELQMLEQCLATCEDTAKMYGLHEEWSNLKFKVEKSLDNLEEMYALYRESLLTDRVRNP